MLKNGLPFVIPLVDVCHFKLPSQGPHKAIHFVWRKPRGDEDDDPPANKVDLSVEGEKIYILFTITETRDPVAVTLARNR